MSEYQRDRVRIFIDPSQDELGTGFNVLQAETSVGAGGLFGKGLTEGTQTQLDFLQTQQTDFIFSVLGEELGFVGAIVLFALFLLLIFRLLRAILKAPDTLGQLIVRGYRNHGHGANVRCCGREYSAGPSDWGTTAIHQRGELGSACPVRGAGNRTEHSAATG